MIGREANCPTVLCLLSFYSPLILYLDGSKIVLSFYSPRPRMHPFVLDPAPLGGNKGAGGEAVDSAPPPIVHSSVFKNVHQLVLWGLS